jgi:hypothetical protein
MTLARLPPVLLRKVQRSRLVKLQRSKGSAYERFVLVLAVSYTQINQVRRVQETSYKTSEQGRSVPWDIEADLARRTTPNPDLTQWSE